MNTTTAAAPTSTAPARWWSLERIAGLSGIVFVLVLVVGDVVRGAPPDNTSTPEDLAQWYEDHSWGVLFSHITFNISTFFFFLFIAYLWKTLRSAEGDPAWLSAMVFGAGVMGAAIATIGYGFWGTAGTIARYYELTPEVAVLLFNLTVVFFMAWLGLNVVMLGTALLIFRTGVFPRWLAWLGLVDIALWLVNQWPIPPDASTLENIFLDYPGPPAHAGQLIWVIAISVILTRRAGRRMPAEAAAE